MIRFLKDKRTAVIFIWMAFVISCGWLSGRASFTADLSAFLPTTPTAEQRLLVDLLRDGMVSRLILVGIEGADAETRARLSKGLAKRLRDNPAFIYLNNGEPFRLQRDSEFLFANRYLFSPTVTVQRFSVAGLHAAIGESLTGLASSAGLLLKSLLPRDPTGEMGQLLDGLDSRRSPASLHGAWASKDGKRALLLLRTHAMGSDIDGLQQAIAAIRQAFEVAVAEDANIAAVSVDGPRLLVTGTGVFSVAARETIRNEAIRLSILSSLLIVALLLAIYRSLATLALGLLPVVSGTLAGVAAVSLGFGMVHGITLGFGTTLIGESVDYSIYLFIQSERGENWVARFWPTVRLGVLTSVFGFASLVFSGFPGLAQLGLYSIAGLLTAAAVTRFVLPALCPNGFAIRDMSPVGIRLQSLFLRAQNLRWVLAIVLAFSCVVIYRHRDTVWNHEISALSPVSASDQLLDASLRTDMGAPDVRYLAVVSGSDSEAALVAAEKLGERLQTLVAEGVLAGFETPARFLPSIATQQARLDSLPTRNQLQERLRTAVAGLPVRADRFTPFVADVEAARNRGLLQRSDLDGTSLGLGLDGLLFRQGQRWIALLPLIAPPSGPSPNTIDPVALREALALEGGGRALFVDIKNEADLLYGGYLREAIRLSLAGLAAILVLLLVALRLPGRVVRVLAPLVAAALVVVGGLALDGQRLTILHLVGLLLIVAVGSNYSLFFDKQGSEGKEGISSRTLASLLFANLTTVTGFGLLAFSTVPVLQAIGITVGPGAVIALVFSAIFADHPAP